MYFCGCGRLGRTSDPRPSMAATNTTAAAPKIATVRYWRRNVDIGGDATDGPYTTPTSGKSRPAGAGGARSTTDSGVVLSAMAPSYHRLGEVPAKRHVAFRAHDGVLYNE